MLRAVGSGASWPEQQRADGRESSPPAERHEPPESVLESGRGPVTGTSEVGPAIDRLEQMGGDPSLRARPDEPNCILMNTSGRRCTSSRDSGVPPSPSWSGKQCRIATELPPPIAAERWKHSLASGRTATTCPVRRHTSGNSAAASGSRDSLLEIRPD